MQVIKKTKGTYIPYSVRGSKITFLDGAMTLDLAKYQRDYSMVKDIMVDEDGNLTMGKGFVYAAQITIPEKEYEDTIITEIIKKAKKKIKNEVTTKTPKAIDMNKVILTLFAIDGANIIL